MADETVIRVEGLGKKYLIGHETERQSYMTLRDTIVSTARKTWQRTLDTARGRPMMVGDTVEEIWALKDIDFAVKRGEVVGIVGRNGAGKSTLLKVLARITEPTVGRVEIDGRVASLLEVGTGFHSELTGRENIYLNGAILGMTREEIRRKFDEIVDFSGIERFLDTPVKRYSSGMYVRLAFAVAAHLEPEILIVDEVLAVGDADFQKKCLGKMQDVTAREGRAVLFVSHNLSAVNELTSRALLLDRGCLKSEGSPQTVISRYLSLGGKSPAFYQRDPGEHAPGPHVAEIEVVTSEPNGIHQFGQPLEIKLVVRHRTPVVKACMAFQIVNQYQQPAIYAFAYPPEVEFGRHAGESTLICRLPRPRLNVGRYYICVYLGEPPGGQHFQTLDGVCPFEVVRTDTSVLWGWRTEVCVYHEDVEWTVNNPI